MTRKPNPVDVHVGARVRLRRMTLGMSQEKLGLMLGLTFQQVQKYEKGANRIGASRLYDIARILDAPIQYFFDEMEEEEPTAASRDARAVDAGANDPGFRIADFVATAEGLDLNRSFQKITDVETRRHLADLVRSVAAAPDRSVAAAPGRRRRDDRENGR